MFVVNAIIVYMYSLKRVNFFLSFIKSNINKMPPTRTQCLLINDQICNTICFRLIATFFNNIKCFAY